MTKADRLRALRNREQILIRAAVQLGIMGDKETEAKVQAHADAVHKQTHDLEWPEKK